MKTTTYLWMALTIMALTNSVNAQYARPCGDGVDLCQWVQAMPLGSQDNSGCGLSYNTYWALNTDTTATCSFDGSLYQGHTLYISIDNDVLSCTLNGVPIFGPKQHDGCAPADPRNGYVIPISPTQGSNTLVCEIRDRGVMSHFDACVVGENPVTPLPEYSSLAVPMMILLAVPAIAFVIAKRQKR